MANNYYQFSTMLHGPKEALDWIQEAVTNLEQTPEYFERKNETSIWIADSEGIDLNPLLGLISAMQEAWKECPPFKLGMAYFCDKLRVDEFGGVGIVVMNGDIEIFDIYALMDNIILTKLTDQTINKTS